jgi:hypothetical protein
MMRGAALVRDDDDAERSDEEEWRLCATTTMQSEAMRRSGACD